MILSDLQRLPVECEGKRIGYVADARFEVESDFNDVFGDMVLVGIIVSERRSASFLGYERSGVNAPWLIARFLAWRHRGSFLIGWQDIEIIKDRVVTVRSGFDRRSSRLDQ